MWRAGIRSAMSNRSGFPRSRTRRARTRGSLAELALKEFHDLTHGVEAELAVNLFGLLTAAAGPLTVADLRALLSDGTGATGATVGR